HREYSQSSFHGLPRFTRLGSRCDDKSVLSCTSNWIFSRWDTSRSANEWEELADRSVKHNVGDVIQWRRLRVHDDDASACGLGGWNGARDRIHLEARSDREQKVRLPRRVHGSFNDLGYERLAKGDRVALQYSVAHAARRVLLPGAHATQSFKHRS